MFFESHAHYDDERYDSDRDDLLLALDDNGVDTVINIGTSVNSSMASIRLAEQYGFVYATVGVHPHEAKTLNNDELAKLKALAAHPKCVAVGEIGLDFYHDLSPRDIQRKCFARQLEMAFEVGKPVVIHSRDASQEVFGIIKDSRARSGVIHCFSDSAEMAYEYVGMGFYLGIGGIVTFNKSRKLAEVVYKTPLDALLLETDCPYLTPTPYRGQRNESKYLSFIAAKIANIKNTTIENVAEITARNAANLFLS
ncbi:MAG: TatD family hydrolase [Clostridiales bacterium]|jgi:TatD DNase family protein|nr:TatD family hydrolase [Clostridiales bacterium]